MPTFFLPPQLRPRIFVRALLCAALGAGTGVARADIGLSEEDFFAPVPVVLTVSRLAQSLHDTPGAVTVLDRDTIRSSGARDMTDLLRLVPGYVVSGFNGANLLGAYHAVIDEQGTRNLVLLNGRSLYSSVFLGSTVRGLSSVWLEDVERVEVLRGSNSAAYGANALFGVINIVTRHSADTPGQEVAVAVGEGGVADAYARIGWGAPGTNRTYRLSVGQRADDGFEQVHDSRRIQSIQWQADWRLGSSDEVLLELGLTRASAGQGFGGFSDPLRQMDWSNQYLHAQWERKFSEQASTKLSLSYDEGQSTDQFRYEGPSPLPGQSFVGSLVDYGAREQRWNLELQHQRVASEQLRWLGGVGFKRDQAWSRALFGTDDAVHIDDARIFGSLEWRWSPAWVLNASVFAGHNSDTGAYAHPRLFVNHHIDPHQSLRIGYSQGQRNPTLFEKRGNQQVFSQAGVPLAILRGNPSLGPEIFSSLEAGYFVQDKAAGLSVDVRLFHEQLRDVIEQVQRRYVSVPEGLDIRGLELQLRWEVTPTATLWWNQTWLETHWHTPDSRITKRHAPSAMTTVAWFQRLTPQWDMTLQVHARNRMNWRNPVDNTLDAAVRADLRLARHWRSGGRQGELALVLQSLNGEQTEFVRDRRSAPRALLTTRLEF